MYDYENQDERICMACSVAGCECDAAIIGCEDDRIDWVAALFANFDPTAREALTVKRKTCSRCSGTGRLSYYSHIKSGQCFSCNGNGFK